MTDHIDKMKEEHNELRIKLTALNAAIYGNDTFKEVCTLERTRMIKQSCFMEQYVKILESRIWAALPDLAY